jgi:hypothetical protein
MTKERVVSLEAQALERIVHAAREVYVASTALQTNFGEEGSRQPSTLELVRFAAAMQELKDAREAFDILVSEKQSNKNKVSSKLFTGESL